MLLYFIYVGPKLIKISYFTATINIKCPHSYQPMAGNIVFLRCRTKSNFLLACLKCPWYFMCLCYEALVTMVPYWIAPKRENRENRGNTLINYLFVPPIFKYMSAVEL